MKIVISIICIFLIAMTTSVLLDWDFIRLNIVRYVLVILLIVFELITGFFYVKSEIKIVNQQSEI
jgi:hypothetical protein